MNLKSMKIGQSIVFKVTAIFSPKEFPIERGNFKLGSIGTGAGEDTIVWVTDNKKQFKNYMNINIRTLKEAEGKDFKDLNAADKKVVKELIDHGMKLLKERPLVRDLEKELKGQKIGIAEVTKIEPFEDEVIFITVEAPEYNFKERYSVDDSRGYFDLTFKHNHYDIGKDVASAAKEFISMISSHIASSHEQPDSDNPKVKKEISKQAKELNKSLRQISSEIIGLKNEYNKLIRDWSGKDGSNWRNNRMAYPALRKYLNKLEMISLHSDAINEIITIENELEKLS